MSTYHLGVDVGGTFTDLVAVDEQGQVTFTKVLSTPSDPSLGVMDGLDRLAGLLGSDLRSLLGSTDRIVHGTTVATNALLEHKGARVGMLTTEGHRDVIEMREGLKPDRYNLRMPAPEPLVPRRRRFGVRERLRADGKPSLHLDQRSLDAAIAQLREHGVDSVAVCYLHAYRDDRHEVETLRRLTRALPEAYVSLSSAVLPQIKEYERFGTTVVNAYVGPILAAYLLQLERRLTKAGFGNRLLVMQSHGGVAPVAEAVRLAAAAVLSGPAGGVAGGQYATKIVDAPDLITLDMGGTSTDVSLIVNGASPLASDRLVAGQPVALPSLDIAALGLGGGSIASADAGGLLRVGPTSAGADPGPACYGRGGRAATITDANLVLGYLDPANFLGGRTVLDVEAAKRALDQLADRLGLDRIAAADGVHRMADAQLASELRLISVRRGFDPRGFALLAFGGAAGLHVAAVARELEMPRILIPPAAAVLSAWGMLATDLRYELVRTHIGDMRTLTAERLRRLFADLESAVRARLGDAGETQVRVERALDMRYGEQIFEITVALDDVDLDAADVLERIVERFHRRHEALYTYSSPEHEVVLVNARLTGVGVLPELPKESVLPERPSASPRAVRTVYLGGWLDVPVFDFGALGAGQRLAGPAIVESDTTTVLLGPADVALVTRLGWLDVRVGSAAPD
ncbi:MAG: hydantoinase/oxoprolinase family protein [Chloroflexi bacterium]|nr:hydantoinase/oxoprolinase family protein [Chloroflexota bacterium]